MNKTTLNQTRKQAATITSLVLMGYGLLLCATNRTEHYLFIKSISFTRIGQGILLASIGLLILLLQYGIKETTPEKNQKRRPKR
ncbi:MAG: hypothetical protein NWF07_16190 [Candidatus Bathyarchaeota archaeon]|nr:hypothetical protein [Candidatus Bathyarchaeota archaeon]